MVGANQYLDQLIPLLSC